MIQRKIYRFLGGSGTFKGTTIVNLMKGARLGYCLPVFSAIKPWKRHSTGALKDYIRVGNNMDLAGLGICILEQGMWQMTLDPDLQTMFVERSILDNLFYWCKENNKNWREDPEVIKEIEKLRKEEIITEMKYNFKEEKNTILSMEDEEFIENEILKEPTRREWFPTVKDYLDFQLEYIEFIKKFINLGNTLYLRRISNAPMYLETINSNKVGEVWPSEKI